MARPRRPSERGGALGSLGLTRARRGGVVLALALAAGALGACRQTVVLDSPADEGGPGAAGASGTGGGAGAGQVMDGGPEIDADKNGGGGGPHGDGGHLEVLPPPVCFGASPLQMINILMRSPLVIVSVDRSTDTQQSTGNGTRLDVIQQEMPVLLSKFRFVKFGYQEFPSPVGMCNDGQGCCAGDVALPTFGNFRNINRIIHACDGGGAACNQPQRPIADALAKCYDTYKMVTSPDDSGHRYVILLASGDPTCTGSDPTTTPCDDALARLVKLNNMFTSTAVIKVGNPTSTTCLDSLAGYSGLETRSGSTPNEISTALANAVQTFAEDACKIDVRSPITDPKKVQLLFDSTPVPNDPLEGWTFDTDADLTLTVHGSYCHSLTQSVRNVQLVSGCIPGHY
jgi:hypothetical protein